MTDNIIISFFEALQSPSIITSSTGMIIRANEAAGLILELSPVESEGQNLADVISRLLTAECREKPDFPFPGFYEIAIRSYKGMPGVLKVRTEKLKFSGNPYYWHTFEITELSQVDKISSTGGINLNTGLDHPLNQRERDHLDEVEVIKERYRLAVEASQTGVGDYNFENDVLVIDESLHELLGYNDHPDNSKEFWGSIIHPEDQPKLYQLIEDYFSERKTYFEIAIRMRHQRRIYLWTLCRGKILYKHRKPVRIIFALTDISERIESTEQLKNALINFKSVFDAFPDLFFKLNRLGDYLEVRAGNKQDLIWPDYSHFIGKNIRDALPSETYHKYYKVLVTAFESREIQSIEYSLTINDKLKFFEARIIAISDNEAIAIVRNITEAVKNNLELIEAKKIAEQALNTKDEFLSTVSHEIRTPLNVVIGMAYLLLQNNPRTDQLKYLDTLRFSSSGLINIINDLLDLSKIRSGRLELEQINYNLVELLNNIRESYLVQLDQRPVRFKMDIGRDVPQNVTGDPNRLTQILNNLLNNASKFTERGFVSLNVSVVGESHEHKIIEFSVKDSGIGIEPSKIGIIFEPYMQSDAHTFRKYGGTGLGLAIIKQLVEMQNGSISVESVQGEGSSFKVRLPVLAGESSTSKELFEKVPVHNVLKDKNLRILYADDVASNRFLMQGYFDLWGCELETASDGQEVLTKTGQSNYDIILMDLQMPVMDGYKATRAIRNLNNGNRQIPVIAITGDVSSKVKNAILDAGFNDFLVKPINPVQLYEMIIHSILGEKYRHKPEIINENIPDTGTLTIGFRQVDMIYSEVPDQYQQLLEMLIREYEGYQEAMVESLRKGDFDEFRIIRHSMASNIKLFKMNSLSQNVDNIRKRIEENPDQPVQNTQIKELKERFSEVIDAFSQKLKTLISQ